jgi:hypothetical protein
MRKQKSTKYTRQLPGPNKAASQPVKNAGFNGLMAFSTSEYSGRLVKIRNEQNEVSPRQPIDPVPPKPKN